jgi:hypothetical protein
LSCGELVERVDIGFQLLLVLACGRLLAQLCDERVEVLTLAVVGR